MEGLDAPNVDQLGIAGLGCSSRGSRRYQRPDTRAGAGHPRPVVRQGCPGQHRPRTRAESCTSGSTERPRWSRSHIPVPCNASMEEPSTTSLENTGMLPRKRDQTARRRVEIARIHLQAKQLGIDEEVRRQMMHRLTGKRSTAEMDASDRAKVLDHLRRQFGKASNPGRPHNIDSHEAPGSCGRSRRCSPRREAVVLRRRDGQAHRRRGALRFPRRARARARCSRRSSTTATGARAREMTATADEGAPAAEGGPVVICALCAGRKLELEPGQRLELCFAPRARNTGHRRGRQRGSRQRR